MTDEASSVKTAPGLAEGPPAPFHVLPPSSSGAPAALNSQDDYDAFVRYLRSKIASRLESELDPDVQDAIALLMRLLATMHRETLARNRVYFETAFDLLAADKPNLALVRSLCSDLANAEEKDVRGVTGIILYFSGDSPISAVCTAPRLASGC
jgi:hypothetical protein